MVKFGNESNQTVFVAGGAGGLGKAIAKQLASKGAHVTIFGRTLSALDEATETIQRSRLNDSQRIRSVVVDLSDHNQVEAAFRDQGQIPNALYCTAGGNHAQNGFLADITADQIATCMKNNYYATAYPAKTILDIWIGDDAKHAWSGTSTKPKSRKIVIISSAAAFVGLPGSIAYTPAKVAVRAMADTLRLEMLRYSSARSKYTVHIAFPGDFISPGFYREQVSKTPLTKQMQGLNGSIEELEARYPSSEQVALLILDAVADGEFIICRDSLPGSMLFTGMTGPSPKRGFGIIDFVVGFVVSLFVWPCLRYRWERMCKKDGQEWQARETNGQRTKQYLTHLRDIENH